MDFIFKTTDPEIKAMSRYAEELIEDTSKNKKEERYLQSIKPCTSGGKHIWVRKFKSKNHMIRYCRNDCGIVKHKYFTNENLQYIEKHLGDFAQPGSPLWHKLYGNRTLEEVRNLN